MVRARRTVEVLNTAVSGTTAYTSSATYPSGNGYVTYDVEITGTPTGTPIIEVDNTGETDISRGTENWQTYTLVTLPAVTTAVQFGVRIRPGYRRVRFKYTNASSTGTVVARAHAS